MPTPHLENPFPKEPPPPKELLLPKESPLGPNESFAAPAWEESVERAEAAETPGRATRSGLRARKYYNCNMAGFSIPASERQKYNDFLDKGI